MNIIRTTLFVVLFFTGTNVCSGQSKIFDLVWKDLEKIQKSTKEPIIVIGPQRTFSITSIRLKTDPNQIIREWYYIIFRQANKNYAIRYVETMLPYNNQKYFKSKPAEFSNDTLFTSLSNHQSEILSEEILSFIYQDSVSGVSAFKKGFVMHTSPFGLAVYFAKDVARSFEFEHIDMEPVLDPQIPGMPVNLNFEFNKRTNIFSLYSIIKDLLPRLDNRFEF